MSLRAKEKGALHEFVSKVKASLGRNLLSIRLFGSKARGDSTKGSDIDVVVIVTRLASDVKDQVFDIAFDVNLEFGVWISPRVVSARVFSTPLWRITPFARSIKKDGIRL